jgi:hypothetical protein
MQLFQSPMFRSFEASVAQNDHVFGATASRYGRTARRRPAYARTFGHELATSYSPQPASAGGNPDEEEISRYDEGHAA